MCAELWRAKVELHTNVLAIRPTLRSGGKYLVITTDLALPGSPQFDGQKFRDLEQWAESYRIRRYPDLELDFRRTG
jgi:hypothetical protein